MPIPTTAAPRIRATGRKQIQLISKAGKEQIAAYDEAGKLIGTFPMEALQQLAQLPDPKDAENAKVAAAAAKVAATHPAPDPTAPDTVVADLTKNVESVLKAMKPRPADELVDLRKAVTTLDKQWKQLLTEAGPSRAIALQSAVATSSLTLMTAGRRIDGARAVNIAKRAACTAAVKRRVI